jgi:hypothetical protein
MPMSSSFYPWDIVLLLLRLSLSIKTFKSGCANLLSQRLLHHHPFAIRETSAVRRAYDGRDFTLPTYQKFASTLLPWHRKTDRAGNVNTKIHNRTPAASWAGGLKGSCVPGLGEGDLYIGQDWEICFRHCFLGQKLSKGVTQLLEREHQIMVAHHNATKPPFQLSFNGSLGRNELQYLAGSFCGHDHIFRDWMRSREV